ncbi:hypothetical protein EDB87DRAFT_1637203 [Lactarius vividus]|nr:hypothetical protein EDB87DRAFT_1637203 [Lactarius vividus]
MRSRRRSPPTDSEDEDPFHFDNILSSPPSKRDDSPGRTLSSSLFRRASIVPVDPSAAPAPHRFSLLREHASDGTIFKDDAGVCAFPASGLPNDMVNMLEELENLALELGQTLPRIVVTWPLPLLGSAELLHPPPTSLDKEKYRLIEPELEPEPAREEEPARSPALPSEQSLACIYLPEVSARSTWRPSSCPGSSTSPILQPADGFHSKPPPLAITNAHSSRQRAFFAALRDREPVRSTRSGIARRITAAAATTRQPAEAKDVPPTPPKSRAPMKSALPVLKVRSTAAPAMGTRTTPPSSESYKGPAAASRIGAGRVVVDERRPAIPTPAVPAPLSARKLKHFFRRPPTRSASDPPAYASVRQVAEGGAGVGTKRPASEVVQAAPREVGERSRMPRLPSARDLIRKLT